MAKPAILTVDDDPEVLRSIERDLRRKYASSYRVLRAESGGAALDLLRQLEERNEPVALLLSDQRMPEMSGVELLEQARRLAPRAKRVLLTAYADTNAAIAAINTARLDHYLLKPWDPPEESLYPVLDDLLDDWKADYRPPFEGIRLLGSRWNRRAHALKEFLGRNNVPYRWLDVDARESDKETRALVDRAAREQLTLPVVVLPDGTALSDPPADAVAERIGLRRKAEMSFYDLVIVGAGPAGLAAAVYGASEGLRTVLIEREAPGGQAGMSSRIENYLGFPSGLTGADLARRAVTQARRFGVELLAPHEAVGLRAEGPYRIVTLGDGTELSGHAVLIATGLTWRELDAPGVARLHGAGVYYGAALTEAMSCEGEEVFIVGGANSAGQAAVFFSSYARKVTMLVRAESLARSMSQYLIDQIAAIENIEVETRREIVEAHGAERLESISVRDADTGDVTTRDTSALFIFIGAAPCTEWLQEALPLDEKGYVLTGDLVRALENRHKWPLDRDPFLFETAVPGVFVAGDTRHGSVKRIASGVGEGSVCVQMIHEYLKRV